MLADVCGYPPVSGKYLVIYGGNYILGLDTYTTKEDAVRIFDEGVNKIIKASKKLGLEGEAEDEKCETL